MNANFIKLKSAGNIFKVDMKTVKKGKGKVVPVLNVMKRYEEWRYSSSILDLGTRWR
jgi:hypothetical protein